MATATARRSIQLENQTRAVWHFPKPGTESEAFTLGDKRDTDEEIAQVTGGAPRNDKLAPHPTATLTPEEWDALGPANHKLIEELVRAKQIKRTELAA